MNSPNPSPAEAFRRLHQEGLLLLSNAWDAGTARLIESLGARAIASTSAGVAWSHGYADGDELPIKLLVATVAEIVRVVRVPLSVDVEGGYSVDPVRVAENVAAVIGAGAVGINLEDGDGGVDLLCAKIAAVKQTSARLGIPLFINARTDVFLFGLFPPERRLEESLARAAAYREAGADGIFVPGVIDPADIRALATGQSLPLNVLARRALPPAAALEELGVRRLSAGSWVTESVFETVRSLTSAFLRDGESAPLTAHAMPYGEINALMAEPAARG